MLLKNGLILCLIFVFTHIVKAQEGRVEVVKDPLITALQNFRAEHALNPNSSNSISLVEKTVDKKNARRVKMRGFRVQIFSGANRNDAVNAQNSFLRQHADIGAYLNYEEPNYRVKVGDFRTRSEATSFMQKLRNQYQEVFVFVEDIWVWQ